MVITLFRLPKVQLNIAQNISNSESFCLLSGEKVLLRRSMNTELSGTIFGCFEATLVISVRIIELYLDIDKQHFFLNISRLR